MGAGRGPVVVVSGLPRTGTSLVMQMLAAAGLPLLHDDARPADESNPRGYYELAEVKRLPQRSSWLEGAGGHAVKVVSPLLPFLPPDRHYRVLLCERRLDEVLDSQEAMLRRLRGEAASGEGARDRAGDGERREMERAFAAQLQETGRLLSRTSQFQVLRVGHRALLADPLGTARRIHAFVGAAVDLPGGVEAMAAVVDPALHRQRRP